MRTSPVVGSSLKNRARRRASGARAVGVIEDELDALIEALRRERDRKPRAACERQDANTDES